MTWQMQYKTSNIIIHPTRAKISLSSQMLLRAGDDER